MNILTHILAILPVFLFAAGPLWAQSASKFKSSFTCTELPNQKKLPVSHIGQVIQDGEGYMWYGTNGGGVCRDDGYDLRIYNSSQRGCKEMENDEVTALAEGTDGRIWVGTRAGLYYIDKLTGRVKAVKVEEAQHKKIHCLAVRADGALWFGVERKVVLLSPNLKVLNTYSIGDNPREEPKNMMIDSKGTLWVAILRGGLRSMAKDGQKLEKRQWTLDKAANCIAEDTVRGCYWVGTWGKGIVSYPDMTQHVGTLHNSDQNIFGSEVNNMVVDYRRNILWTSTMDNLYAYRIVSVLGIDNKRINTLIPLDTSPFLSSEKKLLGYLTLDRYGNVWVPGRSPHTFILSEREADNVRRDEVKAMSEQMGYKLMVSKIVREGDYYWIYQDRTRLSLYNSRTGRLSFMATEAKPEPLSTTKSLSKCRQHKGVWTSSGRRLLRAWHEGDQIHWKEVESVKLPNYIASLNDVGNGELLIGTEKQVFSYHYNENKLNALTDSVGIVQSIGYDAKGKLAYTLKAGSVLPLHDKHGHVWELTETSLTETSGKTGAQRIIRPTDQDVQMEAFTDISLTDDSICLGGIGAFCLIGPSRTLDHKPRTAETIVMVDSSHVSTLNPLHVSTIRFAYRFSEADDWTYLEPGDNRIDFGHLGSGTHTLEVKATDSFGRWGEPQKLYTFTRGNTWPWTVLLLLLAATGCGYWYWRRRKKKALSPAPSSTFVQEEGIPNNEPGTNGELQEAEESGKNAFMQRVTELINKNIDNQDYNVENLATDLGMSRMNMYRKFQAYGEKTPSEYIRTLRLQRAADLLLHSDKSVSEIAYAVGFTSPQYFTKCFKEDYGITPKKYKNNPGKA